MAFQPFSFLTALHLLAPVLWHSETPLTGLELEAVFKPHLHPSGSNRRQKESLAYLADYLLDCEGLNVFCFFFMTIWKSKLPYSVCEPFPLQKVRLLCPWRRFWCLQLDWHHSPLPPGLELLPRIENLDDSPLSMANTCSNLLKLPLLDLCSVFKSQMDFGIQNSPEFGCY